METDGHDDGEEQHDSSTCGGKSGTHKSRERGGARALVNSLVLGAERCKAHTRVCARARALSLSGLTHEAMQSSVFFLSRVWRCRQCEGWRMANSFARCVDVELRFCVEWDVSALEWARSGGLCLDDRVTTTRLGRPNRTWGRAGEP